MSDQLAISAAFSVLAMAAFALASPHFVTDAGMAHDALGATLKASAALADKVPALPGLADLIR